MEVTTSPVKWKFLKDDPENRAPRAQRTKVSVLEFIPGKDTRRRDFHSSRQLSDAFSSNVFPKYSECSRLFIVEDLSRDVIEILGAELDVDPLFFRSHISDYLWYNTRDPWVELPDLDIVSRERNFFNLRYVQARYFRTPESFEKSKQETGMFNVLRRLDSDKNQKATLDEHGSSVALVRSKASFWFSQRKQNEGDLVGKCYHVNHDYADKFKRRFTCGSSS